MLAALRERFAAEEFVPRPVEPGPCGIPGKGSPWATERPRELCLRQGKSVLSRSPARRQLAVLYPQGDLMNSFARKIQKLVSLSPTRGIEPFLDNKTALYLPECIRLAGRNRRDKLATLRSNLLRLAQSPELMILKKCLSFQ